MELKDVILSTLAELEDSKPDVGSQTNRNDLQPKRDEGAFIQVQPSQESILSGEMAFLASMRERLLVLFEGFQAPNNTNIEAKVDMTLNFLEYVLVTIDSRMEELEKGSRK
ncbi:MAG: hypothetical protein PHX44_04570 [Sulfurimonas sp.]|uniref:CiaD-like domain-containing protein n=1 Tax=Sulfurimonas sp. TaxID=2022749 RepID=UPI002622AAF4|nr:hypothetical protein [Sulfurimonas sp.]MDD2652307.1 hypothetical protein [Sulfurimonas sp.]MDD3451524.1 hypothetical protein [Sulfurimonas sp.]